MPRKAPAKTAPQTEKPKAAAKSKARRGALPISTIETAFCHFLIQGKSTKEASEALGLGEEAGQAFLRRQQVQEYMAQYQEIFREKMAAAEVSRLLKQEITRESIAESLMLLAMMPPERTRGSIDGQVKALGDVATLLNLKLDLNKLPALLSAMSDEEIRQATGLPPEKVM